MPQINSLNPRAALMLLVILAIAAFLRLGELGVVEFRHDEAMLSLLAQDVTRADTLPLTGIPSSVGIPNPPISVYVMALPYALSADPLLATLFVAALNVVGVALLWLLAYRYLGTAVAFAAGLAYALNPWAVLYSRKIWAQDFHTPLLLAALLLGLYGFGEGKRWAQWLCLPVFVLALQVHFAAWALLPLFLVLLVMGRRHISWLALLGSIALAALTLLPFLIGLLQTLAQDPNRLNNALDATRAATAFREDALIYTVGVASGAGLETEVSGQQSRMLLAQVPQPTLLWLLVIGGMTLLGVLVIWLRRTRFMAVLILLWALLPLLVFTPAWTEVYPHYFIASIPAYSLLSGMGSAFVAERLPGQPAARFIVLGAFGAVLLTQGVWWRGMLRYVDTVHTPEGFGTPLHYLLDARDALAQSDHVLVLTDGVEILYDQEPAIWSAMLRDSADCVGALAGNEVAVFPAGPFATLRAPNAPPNPGDNLYTSRLPSALFPLRQGEGDYAVYLFQETPAWPGPALTPVAPVQFDNGAQLTGYHLETNRMLLEWQLPGRVNADYHYFGHFLDANGERLGQRDGLLWPGRYWCAGDRLITSIDIALPEGVSTLRVGMYRLEGSNFVNSNVMDAAGNPIGQWADIELPSAGP